MAEKFKSISFAGDNPVELMRGHMVTQGARHVMVSVTPVGA
jgi:hypothetical protein